MARRQSVCRGETRKATRNFFFHTRTRGVPKLRASSKLDPEFIGRVISMFGDATGQAEDETDCLTPSPSPLQLQ